MTVIVTDTRIKPSEADATAGWTGTDAPVLFTADPYPVELTGSLGQDVSTETHDLYYGITSVDLSDTLIYIWALANGIMDTLINGGVAVILYDSTNKIGYHVAGNDHAVFRYSNTNVAWQCLVIDTGNLPSNFTARAGSEASLLLTAITGIGAMYKTLAKALGGTENCFTDVIRYGNDGLIITGGASGGTEGLFSEIATEDSSDATGKALGIIRGLGTDLYELQGGLTFGDSVGTAATYFADENTIVSFADIGVASNKYFIKIVGNATGSTTFKLGLQVGSTIFGNNGCILSCPIGVGAYFDASDINLQYVLLYGSSISGFSTSTALTTDIKFSSDGTNALNHKIYGNNFTACGMIDIGKTYFKNNSISATTDANGAMLISSTTSLTNVSDLNFTSDGTGHAIYITATGTYSFDTFDYTGYGANDTTDAVVYNNSGGLVTINPTGGGSITVRNGTSASTVINNSQTVSITVRDTLGTVIENVRVFVEAGATGSEPSYDSVTATAIGTTASIAHTAHGMASGEWITIRGANEIDYNGTFQISNVTTDAYDYTMGGSPTSPATGSLTSTLNIINKLTDVSGIASETFNYASDQQIQGYARMSTSSPLYRSAPINGTIESSGFISGVTLVGDE